MTTPDEDPAGADRQRLDKWLWCARFFKSRAQATEAVAGGKVHLNGARVKPAHAVGAGDLLTITLGARLVEVEVRGVMARRGPAGEARRHYEETPASVERGRRLAEQRRLVDSAPHPAGRPDKHDRRELVRLQRGQGDGAAGPDRWRDD